MLNGVQWSFWLVGLFLQGLLIVALCQGAAKEFPALFAYVVCLLGTTLADIVAYLVYGTKSSPYYLSYYWSAELVRQTALFAMVISLAIHAIPPGRKADAYARMLTVSAGCVWFGSMAIYYSPDLNTWMTAVARNLSFFTGVLNLFVWFAYVRNDLRDSTRLMIAAGLGMQMSGEAIGQAIRLLHISRPYRLAGSIFIVVTHLLCLFIWWRAFSTTNGHDLATRRRA